MCHLSAPLDLCSLLPFLPASSLAQSRTISPLSEGRVEAVEGITSSRLLRQKVEYFLPPELVIISIQKR